MLGEVVGCGFELYRLEDVFIVLVRVGERWMSLVLGRKDQRGRGGE